MTTQIECQEYCVGPLDQIPMGEGRQVTIGGVTVAVFRSRSGKVLATQAECPHRQGRLADGLIGGTTLICPLHGWKFNMETGEAILGDCGITTYRTRIDDAGDVWVAL